MRNVSIQCTYKNIPWPNSLLMAQVTGCACVQITGGHVHITLDYEGNRVSRVCIYEASWKRSLHPPSASLHFSALSWLPLMMSLVVFRLSNLMLLFQTLSSLNSLQRWAVCRPPGACVIFTSLASLSNVSSCLSGFLYVFLCLWFLTPHPLIWPQNTIISGEQSQPWRCYMYKELTPIWPPWVYPLLSSRKNITMNWFLSLCSELAEVMAQSVPSIRPFAAPWPLQGFAQTLSS